MARETHAPSALRLSATRVFAPMLVGGLIYVLFRSSQYRYFRWLDSLGLGELVARVRALSLPLKARVPSWVLYVLPDGLWVFALSSAALIVWRHGPRRERLAWALVAPTLGAGWELAQFFAWVPGTFDWLDLVASFLGAAFALSVHSFSARSRVSGGEFHSHAGRSI